MLNVTYKEIPHYAGIYLIGSDGSVNNRLKIMKTYVNNSGYECIKINRKGNKKHFLIHRLVAEAFIENPFCKTEVNHIDGNKLNNNVCNLEWATSSENKQHGIDMGLIKYNQPTKGLKMSKLSKYHNVGYDSTRNKWKASIHLNGKTLLQKRFDTEEAAALYVNWALDELNIHDRPRNVVCS